METIFKNFAHTPFKMGTYNDPFSGRRVILYQANSRAEFQHEHAILRYGDEEYYISPGSETLYITTSKISRKELKSYPSLELARIALKVIYGD